MQKYSCVELKQIIIVLGCALFRVLPLNFLMQLIWFYLTNWNEKQLENDPEAEMQLPIDKLLVMLVHRLGLVSI